jgi:hypothetical protein
MKRSADVTVIAVLSLIGSILTLGVGVLVLVVMTLAPPHLEEFPAAPAYFKLLLAIGAMFYLLPAIWGIVTSVGLFRLSKWARISIIVFSCLLILISGFSGLISMFVPVRPPTAGSNPAFLFSIRAIMAAFWLTLLAIGIWWLIFFTRTRVKQQFDVLELPLSPAMPETFAGGVPQPPTLPASRLAPERPVSFTVIAWFLLVGCFFIPAGLIFHFPVVLFTKIIAGWTAGAYYIALTAIGLYVGIGLLRFQPLARTVGVVYYSFFLINSAVFYLAPGARNRIKALFDAQSTMFPGMRFWQDRPELQVDMTLPILLGGVMGLVFVLIPLYFLITRKQAFEAAAARR